MEWHIITGSKGGVGKTLLSLLLLAYHLEEKTNEGILVLDLNAMNTDTASILRYKSTFANTMDIEFKHGIMVLQDVSYSISPKQTSVPFAIGWMNNPFLLHNYTDFADLLLIIKEHADEITKKLNISPLQHVIIDTNYHFCNLFPSQDEDKVYDKYIENHVDDNFNIWFLWVYRQLTKILGSTKDSEIDIIIKTAGAIERKFKQKLGPIIHTYSPLGSLPTEAKRTGFLGLGKENLPDRNKDYIIDEFRKLEKLEKVGEYIEFRKWLLKLQNAQKNVLHESTSNLRDNQDTHRLFTKYVYEAVEELANDEFLPINIFPLSTYQPALEGYTDRERDNTIAQLRELDTYKNFKKLLNRKYGNEIL